MTEFEIQNALYWHLYNSSPRIVVPNFTPTNWWECDVWSVSKNGYSTEYEIKISRADFKKDAEKERRLRRGRELVTEKKHDILQECIDGEGHTHPPKFFYYVTPPDLIQEDEIPDFAGLITKHGRTFSTVKRAPILHRDPADEQDIERARTAFYYRYWKMRDRLQYQKTRTKTHQLMDGQSLLWWIRSNLGEENGRKVMAKLAKRQQTVANILLAVEEAGV